VNIRVRAAPASPACVTDDEPYRSLSSHSSCDTTFNLGDFGGVPLRTHLTERPLLRDVDPGPVIRRHPLHCAVGACPADITATWSNVGGNRFEPLSTLRPSPTTRVVA
jgi:hypothetical protein